MLKDEIKDTAEGLYYISETDAPVTVFEGGKADRVSAEVLLRETKSKKNAEEGTTDDTNKNTEAENIQEISPDEFFANLTRIREGAGEREIEYAKRFQRLKELLENDLEDVKVFKVGESRLDVYIVGLDGEGKLTGVQTQATET